MVSIRFSWLWLCPYDQYFFLLFSATVYLWHLIVYIERFSKTTSTQLLDTPPCCFDTERGTTRDLIGQNMTVECYDANEQSNNCSTSPQLCKHGGVSSNCLKYNFCKISGPAVTPWTLNIYNLRRKILNKIIYFEFVGWSITTIFTQKLFEQLSRVRPSISYRNRRIVVLERREK